MRGPLEKRFWAKVERRGDEECWPWIGALKGTGYGTIWVREGQWAQAHRVAYEILVGAIPDGLQIDHLCRNRACVNPAHLEPVTNRENALRGYGASGRNARKTHCPHGHEYDGTSRNGWRHCKTCACAKTAYYKAVRLGRDASRHAWVLSHLTTTPLEQPGYADAGR